MSVPACVIVVLARRYSVAHAVELPMRLVVSFFQELGQKQYLTSVQVVSMGARGKATLWHGRVGVTFTTHNTFSDLYKVSLVIGICTIGACDSTFPVEFLVVY